MEGALWTLAVGLVAGLTALAMTRPHVYDYLFVKLLGAVFALHLLMTSFGLGVSWATERAQSAAPEALHKAIASATWSYVNQTYVMLFSVGTMGFLILLYALSRAVEKAESAKKKSGGE